jgi:hypothetical protein
MDRLRFDKVATRVIERLQANLADAVPGIASELHATSRPDRRRAS